MNKLNYYVHENIDNFAKHYEGSSVVHDLVHFKVNVDDWIDRRRYAIRDFYRIENGDEKISFVYKLNKFHLRLTFHRNGNLVIQIQSTHERTHTVRDNSMMSQYCLDVGHVYFIESEFGFKIGKTKNLATRKATFGVKLPFPFAVRYHIKTSEKSKIEKLFHKEFENQLINGEWFLITHEDIIKAAVKYELDLLDYPPDENIKIEEKYVKTIIANRQTAQ